jgi:hypothetical protein
VNGPPRPDPDNHPNAGGQWQRRPPLYDDQTAIARPRPTQPRTPPPRRYPPAAPAPNFKQSPAAYRPPARPPVTPWYQRPVRPVSPGPAVEPPNAIAKQEDADAAARKRLIRRLLIGAGTLAVLIEAAVLLGGVSRLGGTGGKVLDVTKVQTGVLQTLSDPAGGYGANTVTDVSCNNGRNPSADKGTTFTCDVTVNGAPRHVTVVLSDDNGTYEIDGPR